jgi:DNA polymerase-3 subunit epsilon
MFQDANLSTMAEALSRSEDYRVLRRLVPRIPVAPPVGLDTKTAVLLDTETTGLDSRNDQIIELGMVKFDYLSDGRIVGVRDIFSAFNEPSVPIPLEVTALTNITDDMVAGHRIDEASVTAFVDDAVIVIAHNSDFDRKFAERYWPIFEQKAWGCSATEIDWRRHGFAGAQLGYLLNGAGFFHHAHRAVDDCHALLEFLACELPTTGAPALALLLETARKPTVRVWAEQSPFELKGLAEASGLPLVRRKRWQAEIMVRRRLRNGAAGRDRVSPRRDLSERDRAPTTGPDRLHPLLRQGLTPIAPTTRLRPASNT